MPGRSVSGGAADDTAGSASGKTSTGTASGSNSDAPNGPDRPSGEDRDPPGGTRTRGAAEDDAPGQARLHLPDEAATLALGRALAASMPEYWACPSALLRAALGSGKTTLARGFTLALPGAELAEVASPSFNLVNVYPTRPPVVHADLYRLGEGFADASLDEALDAGQGALAGEPRRALLVEWAEYMPEALIPGDRLDISLTEQGGGREALLTATGPHARQWLKRTLSTFLQSGKS